MLEIIMQAIAYALPVVFIIAVTAILLCKIADSYKAISKAHDKNEWIGQ